MFAVKESMPVMNYSTKVISDQAGSVFDPVNNSRIRINVPSSLSMVDLRNSYIQFEMSVKAPSGAGTSAAAGNNTFVMKLGNEQGSEQIFRNMRCYLDNREVENIAHVNILEKFKSAYGEDVSLKGLDATFNHGGFPTNGNPSSFVTNADITQGFMTLNRVPTKQVYRPKCSGLWNYPNGLPLLLLGNLTMEWDLEDSARVLTTRANKLSGVTLAQPAQNAAVTTFTLVAPTQASEPHWNGYGWGDTNAEVQKNCPFTIGNVEIIRGSLTGDVAIEVTREITAVTAPDAGTGNIQITVAGVDLNAAAPNDDFTIEVLFGYSGAGVQDAEKYTYEISKVEFVCRAIELPPQYIQGAMRRVQGEGFQMDIQTYTNYVNNILENVGTQSVLIPNYNSRIKSVLSVPLKNVQTDYFYDRKGKIDNLKDYQAIIGQRREPQRPVSVVNQTSSANAFPPQEHLHELTKALSASGQDVRTLRNFRDNFAMSRSLSYDGSSESLQDKGFRFEFNFNSNVVTPKILYSYVYGLKRIMVSAQSGLEVIS